MLIMKNKFRMEELMRKVFIFAICLFSFFLSGHVRALELSEEANLYLSVKWLKEEIKKQPQKNIVFSPVSLYISTALLAEGATGETRQELEKFLQQETVNYEPNFSTDLSLKGLPFHSDAQVQFANSLWGNVKPEFISALQDYGNVEIKELPKNTKEINDWIAKKTNQKLKKVLDEKEVNPLDVYLVNAVYFKGEWLSKFHERDTIETDFYSFNKTVKAHMMNRSDSIDYFENKTMQAVRLPYRTSEDGNGDKEHSMYIFLPKKEVKWADFISNLTANDFYLDFLTCVSVDLFLPRFKFEYQPENLKGTLEKMGLKRSLNAVGFEKISSDSVSMAVTHKATISVDENGTEAAAATSDSLGGFMAGRMNPRKVKFVFNANRPFIFMIDRGLFVGVVSDPSQ